MTKGKAFVLSLTAIMIVFLMVGLSAIIGDKDINTALVEACLKGISILAGLYIGGSVANNGVKGHFFNEEMYDRENPKNEEEKRNGIK